MNKTPWEYADKTNTEHAHQVALFMWAKMAANYGVIAADDPLSYTVEGRAKALGNANPLSLVPDLNYLFAIHNQGHGDIVRGGKAKAEGVNPGVPDICLPVVRAVFGNGWYAGRFGLYIELKRPSVKGIKAGVISDVQTRWMTHLVEQGYKCELAYGWLEARAILLYYLGKELYL